MRRLRLPAGLGVLRRPRRPPAAAASRPARRSSTGWRRRSSPGRRASRAPCSPSRSGRRTVRRPSGRRRRWRAGSGRSLLVGERAQDLVDEVERRQSLDSPARRRPIASCRRRSSSSLRWRRACRVQLPAADATRGAMTMVSFERAGEERRRRGAAEVAVGVAIGAVDHDQRAADRRSLRLSQRIRRVDHRPRGPALERHELRAARLGRGAGRGRGGGGHLSGEKQRKHGENITEVRLKAETTSVGSIGNFRCYVPTVVRRALLSVVVILCGGIVAQVQEQDRDKPEQLAWRHEIQSKCGSSNSGFLPGSPSRRPRRCWVSRRGPSSVSGGSEGMAVSRTSKGSLARRRAVNGMSDARKCVANIHRTR